MEHIYLRTTEQKGTLCLLFIICYISNVVSLDKVFVINKNNYYVEIIKSYILLCVLCKSVPSTKDSSLEKFYIRQTHLDIYK